MSANQGIFCIAQENSENWFMERRLLRFITLNRSLHIKGWMGLVYNRHVQGKKPFNINLLPSLPIAFFKYSLLLFQSCYAQN